MDSELLNVNERLHMGTAEGKCMERLREMCERNVNNNELLDVLNNIFALWDCSNNICSISKNNSSLSFVAYNNTNQIVWLLGNDSVGNNIVCTVINCKFKILSLHKNIEIKPFV